MAALENGVSQVERRAGRLPQVSGLAFAFDPAQPAGARVTRVTVDGRTLDPAGSYTLATADFLARGGDEYSMFAEGEILVDARSGALLAQLVIAHIADAGVIAPAIEGRIVME